MLGSGFKLIDREYIDNDLYDHAWRISHVFACPSPSNNVFQHFTIEPLPSVPYPLFLHYNPKKKLKSKFVTSPPKK